MQPTKKLADAQTKPPEPQAADEEARGLQLKKEHIEGVRRQRVEALTGKASAALAKIQNAMNRIQNQMAKSPAPGALGALHANYAVLEGKAQAISNILSNPKTRVEFHSLDDHPDHGHDDMHHHEEDVHVHSFGGLQHQVHAVESEFRKLNQQEHNYNRRQHKQSWVGGLTQKPQGAADIYPRFAQ